MAQRQERDVAPKETISQFRDCLNYITFWLDNADVKKIQALAALEEHDDFYTFLRYHVVKTGLECLLSNHEEIGRKFAESGSQRGGFLDGTSLRRERRGFRHKEVKIFSITDPRTARLMAAVVEANEGMCFTVDREKDGKVKGVDVYLDCEDEGTAQLLEALTEQ